MKKADLKKQQAWLERCFYSETPCYDCVEDAAEKRVKYLLKSPEAKWPETDPLILAQVQWLADKKGYGKVSSRGRWVR